MLDLRERDFTVGRASPPGSGRMLGRGHVGAGVEAGGVSCAEGVRRRGKVEEWCTPRANPAAGGPRAQTKPTGQARGERSCR